MRETWFLSLIHISHGDGDGGAIGNSGESFGEGRVEWTQETGGDPGGEGEDESVELFLAEGGFDEPGVVGRGVEAGGSRVGFGARDVYKRQILGAPPLARAGWDCSFRLSGSIPGIAVHNDPMGVAPDWLKLRYRMLRGRFFFKRRRFERAHRCFQDALAIQPDHLPALAWLGTSCMLSLIHI